MDVDGKVKDFNLATLLYGNPALEALTLKLSGKGLGKVGGGEGEALRHELQNQLPSRLKKITLVGKDIINIHPAAFKVMRWGNSFYGQESNDMRPAPAAF